MGTIAECVQEVRLIANRSQDFDQAKQCMEQLFSRAKAQRRGQLGIAQRVRDQLNRNRDDTPIDAQLCIDKLIDWLEREYLERSRAD
jgi:hypothetical protein